MGNRAVITFNKKTGIYLHWNGGRDSVEAFLKYCKLQGFRADDYGLARLTQIIANFFGGGLCIGVDSYANMDTDNYDNGVYVVEGWEIVDRLFFENRTEQDKYNLYHMLYEIDTKQPKSYRLFESLDEDYKEIDGVENPEKDQEFFDKVKEIVEAGK